MKSRILFTLICLFLSLASLKAQHAFTIRYGLDSVDETAQSVVPRPGGSLYVGGNTLRGSNGDVDFSFSKCSASGDVLWLRDYGTALPDNCLRMRGTRDGHFMLSGYITDNKDNEDIEYILLDSNGNVVYRKTHGSPLVNETLNDLQETPDGGFIGCGFISDTAKGHSGSDFYFVRLNAQGEVLWEKAYGGKLNDIAMVIKPTAGGEFIFTGDSKSYKNPPIDQTLIGKLDRNGNLGWIHPITDNGYVNGCQSFTFLSDSSIFVVGEGVVDSTWLYQFALSRVDLSGKLRWTRYAGGQGADAAFDVVEDVPGLLMLTGYSNSYDPTKPVTPFVASMDTTGNLLDIQYLRGGLGIGMCIAPLGDHRFAVSGFSQRPDGSQYLLFTTDTTLYLGIPRLPAPDEHSFSVFPNPIKAGGTVRFPAVQEKTQLSLISAYGQLVTQYPLSPGVVSITLPVDLQAGVYYLLLNNGRQLSRTKILVIGE